MKHSGNEKETVVTRLRLEPDFGYVARRMRRKRQEEAPLYSNIDRNPGEIPGDYADDHGE